MKSHHHSGAATKATDPAQVAAWNQILFTTLTRTARTCAEGLRFEEALRWSSVAAWFTSRKGWFGELCSHELETGLLRAAESLPVPVAPGCARSRSRWLHVLTEAYGTLGHTNLCRRWIEYDREVAHDVVLVNQQGHVPENLLDVVKQAGGECLVLDPLASFLERAKKLRAYAWQNADVVVLHIHPEDVIATTAFGVAGGPPVLFVNHADHTFWVGGSVADLVLDIRTSGNLLTRKNRGIGRTAILPLPLVQSVESVKDSPLESEQKRLRRKELGIPDDGIMFLTVGSAAKYQPIEGFDFVKTALAILEQAPAARIIAVGPRDEGAWQAARQKTGGRCLAVGPQPDARRFCQAADVYLEGFPAGSLTALLEAVEAGLPVIRAPAQIVPPLCSDDTALDKVSQPKDLADYVQKAVTLIQDRKTCAETGHRLQQAIRELHCQAGWLACLREIKRQIPNSHSIDVSFLPAPVEVHYRNLYTRCLHATEPMPAVGTIVENVFVEAWKRTNEAPKADWQLWNQLKAADSVTAGSQGLMRQFCDRLSFWQLNGRIRRRGIRGRLIAKANLALISGRRALARRLTYSCLWQCFSSISDIAWLKLFIKTHLNLRGSRELKRILSGGT